MQMALLVLILTTMILGSGARLTLVPDNAAAIQGSEVTMKCRSDSSDMLLWRTLRKSSEETVYTGRQIAQNLTSFFRIFTIKKGEVNLVVKAHKETAKTYICEEYGSSAAKASAELVVLASDPTCNEDNNHAIEVGAMESSLKLVCRLNYWGNWAPVMAWKRISTGMSDGTNSTWIKEGVLNKSDNFSVESVLTIRGSHHNGTRFVCVTHFTQSQRSRNSGANNTPVYSYTWEYPAKGETGRKGTVTAVVTCVVILVFVATTMATYIVLIKRKRPNNQPENLEMEVMHGLGRTLSKGSGYVGMGSSSNIIPSCRLSEVHYIGLREQELAKESNYASLEKKQEIGWSTELTTSEPDASDGVYSVPTHQPPVIIDAGESGMNIYMDIIL